MALCIAVSIAGRKAGHWCTTLSMNLTTTTMVGCVISSCYHCYHNVWRCYCGYRYTWHCVIIHVCLHSDMFHPNCGYLTSYLGSLILHRLLSLSLSPAVGPRMGDIAPSVCPVRLSVTFSFRTVTRNALMYFLETLQLRAQCHGGGLYSFWYWWNVVWIFYEFFKYWKKKKFNIFSIFKVFFAFYAISNIKKIIGFKKIPGGGGGVCRQFFLDSHSFSFHFTFYAIFNIKKKI